MEKNEKLKTVKIGSKPYVPVSERVRYFNEAYPQGMIDTEIVERKDNMVLMKAKVVPDSANPARYFIGYAQEEKGKGMVNATSYIENCQTSAIGRALGIMGIGVEESIASADEIRNASIEKEPEFSEPTEIVSTEEMLKEADEIPDLDETQALIDEIMKEGTSKGYTNGSVREAIEKKFKKDISEMTIKELDKALELIQKLQPKQNGK